jgi:circadian clock protein KaiC
MTDRTTRAHGRVPIRQLPTGVPGLDEILGGGLPEYSFNIIAGGPGSGKTTLAHQIMFANASRERPALYFTVLGEPAVKMLRYQQQYSFFDPSLLDGAIRFINLSQTVLDHDLGAVLEAIAREVETSDARLVVVDSFRTVVRRALTGATELELQSFVQRLALQMTSWQVTSFLVGEYVEGEMRDNPVFTVADGLLWLSQSAERNSIVRKIQVVKMRGQDSVPGLHTLRITGDGVQTFPRTFGFDGSGHVRSSRRIGTGIQELDALMGGGIPEGDSVLLAGPSGTGKTVLASQFIAEGLRHGEPAIIAVFEESAAEYVARAAAFGIDFESPRKEGALEIIYIRPLDLSVDEMMHAVLGAVARLGARRVVIDSLVGFELALAPGFRHEFRDSLYRMIIALTRRGVTVLSTVEIEDDFTSLGLSNFAISFLADDILRLRYVSIDGQLRKMLVVVKMRRSAHSIDLCEYGITETGLVIGEPLRGYRALTSGIPERSPASGEQHPEPRHGRPPQPPSPRGGRLRRRRTE